MTRSWYLETVAADGSSLTHDMSMLPFRVGRDVGNELVVASRGLSRRHAEFTEDISGRLRLTDLDSTNGTYVNRVRIESSALVGDRDVIHFGNAEFKLALRDDAAPAAAPAADNERTLIVPAGQKLSQHFALYERPFLELLSGQGLAGAIQPIVEARTSAPFAHELLGRCTHPDLPASPIRLFSLAAALGKEAELSHALREHGIRRFARQHPGGTLFVNTHPNETFDPAFLESLARLPIERVPMRVVVEVHETAVMEVSRMRELAAHLAAIGARFAYDDFGAGQARLNELGEVPAHFVKFDMGMIRGIDTASERKQKMLRELVRMVHELGSSALAEGVETEAEAVVCREMGFELIQGFLTGRPEMLA
jgi:EAL domain-containing protein (putative c-di-GMP-specific phosphodiesterase class I)